ncbi:transposase [Streptomyces sp. NPDC050508]|uniref:transposase n=1 Tax=Streptomyces sp. NPDC050508 TaxID=3155405 RepID=UPI00342C2365
MPRSLVLAAAKSNALSPDCDCLAHRFGNAADGPQGVRCYGSDLTEAEWQVVRLLLPVPAWLQGWGGRPKGYWEEAELSISKPSKVA